MRLVDIFFKNIKGEASDIKGNINTIGHIMMLAIAEGQRQSIGGYFEIDGSTVANAKVNYPELHNLLLTSNANGMAKLSANGNDIILGGVLGHLSIKAADGKDAGYFRPSAKAQHRHTYYALCAESVTRTTQYENYPTIEAKYTVRAFIYHGVHI